MTKFWKSVTYYQSIRCVWYKNEVAFCISYFRMDLFFDMISQVFEPLLSDSWQPCAPNRVIKGEWYDALYIRHCT